MRLTAALDVSHQKKKMNYCKRNIKLIILSTSIALGSEKITEKLLILLFKTNQILIIIQGYTTFHF